MAYIARTDGSREEIPIATITLDFAKKICGGWVERVCPRKTPSIIFLCNEEGHVHRLPLNAHGEELYGGPIAGDIIVMTRKEGRSWL